MSHCDCHALGLDPAALAVPAAMGKAAAMGMETVVLGEAKAASGKATVILAEAAAVET